MKQNDKVIADSSFVVAIEDKNDPQRKRCLPIYDTARYIFLPQSVLNEVAYLLTQSGGNVATAQFLKNVLSHKYILITFEPEDIARTVEILEKYADTRVDFVDASVVAIAERLRISTVLTLDRRDFSLIRPKHVDYFAVLPSASS